MRCSEVPGRTGARVRLAEHQHAIELTKRTIGAIVDHDLLSSGKSKPD